VISFFSDTRPQRGEVSLADLSVILVSYNTRAMTADCVRKLRQEIRSPQLEIIVVDNDSRDGSFDYLRDHFPDIQVIQSGSNMGFGSACNLGASYSAADLILFLNTDALIDEKSLTLLTNALKANPDIGIVGPKILDEGGTPAISCYRFRNLTRQILFKLLPESLGIHYYNPKDLVTNARVDWVTGCCFVIRRSDFVKIGGFDQNFFLYSEETDLAFRYSLHGLGTLFVPGAASTHIGGGSTTISSWRKLGIMHRSEELLFQKHFGNAAFIISKAGCVTGGIIRSLVLGLMLMISPKNREANKIKILGSLADIYFSFLPMADPRGKNIPKTPDFLRRP
jgi:GT2 family glycosyltransferase